MATRGDKYLHALRWVVKGEGDEAEIDGEGKAEPAKTDSREAGGGRG